MANSNSNNGSGGLFPALLTILFIGLKLTGHIAWSWWWVLSPLWIPAVIVITVGIVAVLLGGKFIK